MAFTYVILATLAAVASAGLQAARYPAGVNPAACPNYPYCDPHVDPRGPGYAAVVAAPYNALGAWAGYRGYAAAAAPYAYAAPALVLPAGGAKYPAGVNPAECPNFPYCHDGYHGNHAVGTYKSAHVGVVPVAHAVAHGHAYAARYPAGVNPHACPNYPYCHDGLHGNHAVAAH